MLNLIILIFCYILMISFLIFLPLYSKKLLSKAGNLYFSFNKKTDAKYYGVLIFSLLLIFLMYFQQATLYTFIINACAVLGFFIVNKESTFKKNYGVYENMIIANSTFVEYSDIVTFPILDLPKEEQENYPKNCLTIATKSKGKINLVFSSDEECSLVIEKLKELKIITEDL